MREALEEAQTAASFGEVPVGAAVFSGDGVLLGKAGNAVERLNDPSAHAEILALRAACAKVGNYRLEGAVMLVTLEPCLMCAGALAHARLDGVVYGARDVRAGAVESCLEGLDQMFLNHRVWHMGGICEDECAALLRRFFEEKR